MSLDSVQLAPVIGDLRGGSGVVIHGALMIAAFGLLLPAGMLVARHRWMFGRDPTTVRAAA